MIRKILEKDIKILTQIVLNYRKEHSIPTCNIENSIYLSFKDVINNNLDIYVATDINDSPKAYINFHIIYFPLIGGKELYISELFVAENTRGKNYGTKLLDFVIDYGKTNSCVRLMLNNSKDSQAYLRSFYKNKRFVERELMANLILLL